MLYLVLDTRQKVLLCLKHISLSLSSTAHSDLEFATFHHLFHPITHSHPIDSVQSHWPRAEINSNVATLSTTEISWLACVTLLQPRLTPRPCFKSLWNSNTSWIDRACPYLLWSWKVSKERSGYKSRQGTLLTQSWKGLWRVTLSAWNWEQDGQLCVSFARQML